MKNYTKPEMRLISKGQNDDRSMYKSCPTRKRVMPLLIGFTIYLLSTFSIWSKLTFSEHELDQVSFMLNRTFSLSIRESDERDGFWNEGTTTTKQKNDVEPTGIITVDTAVEKERPVLTAYIEEVDLEEWWNSKPLAIRKTKADNLKVETFPGLNSCRKLTEQWPIDDPPTERDAFLPWIHDVFPTADGKHIQFIAQNRRRCQTGITMAAIKKRLQPNIALFQQIPIQRIQPTKNNTINTTNTRYRLSSHEDADSDGMATRFICRFKPSMEETLSISNVDYDYHTFRKAHNATFTEEGYDNHMIWTSQLLFQCPVPKSLQETVRLGSSVMNDFATLFVDLVPIRTPPNYGNSTSFLHPKYGQDPTFFPDEEWGKEHILPEIQDSGRFENIPICKPSLMTYPDEYAEDEVDKLTPEEVYKVDQDAATLSNRKKHDLIACTWASNSFHTRGSRTVVEDGQQRLLEWAQFHKLTGVDHIYIFDNSGQFSADMNLKPTTDLFPGFVTRINWPCKVCNNNKVLGKESNLGEHSSQHAAESACRLRFGEHAKWLMSVDTDEYLVPLGDHTDLKTILNDVEKEDIRILQFKSKRAKPRLHHLSTEVITNKTNVCNSGCLNTDVPKGETFLGVYNCDVEKPPRKKTQASEKEIYQTDYVKLHFIRHSTITTESQLSENEFSDLYNGVKMIRRYTERHARFVDEEREASLLHAKALVMKETNNWYFNCKLGLNSGCKVGIPFPEGIETSRSKVVMVNISNYTDIRANCYPHVKIDNFWVPKLKATLEDRLSSRKLTVKN